MRKAVTSLLRESRPHRGERARLAALVGRSVRTLWSWEHGEDGGPGPGRPAHGRAARWRALRAVARQWKSQGRSAGWRLISAALPGVPVRLVQELLPRLKQRARQRLSDRLARRRLHLEILRKDVLWSQDTTHVGTCQGRKVWSEVLCDVGTMKTLSAPVRDRASTTDDVIAQLKEQRRMGRLALVWATDWGAAYKSRRMRRFLSGHRVVALPSLPHTAQHNPWVERRHRDLKEISGLGRGVLLASVQEASQRWEAAREQLDNHRLRSRLGCRTAAEIDGSLATWEGVIDRRTFYATAQRARRDAVRGLVGARARRRAEREAVFRTLERFGLATRTRGGAPLPSPEAEGIS